MKHSNQIREFVITDHGIDVLDVTLGPDGVLIGSARIAKELDDATGAQLKTHARTRKDREVERKRMVLEAQITSLKQEFDSVQEELLKSYVEEDLKKEIMEKTRKHLAQERSKNTDGKRK